MLGDLKEKAKVYSYLNFHDRAVKVVEDAYALGKSKKRKKAEALEKLKSEALSVAVNTNRSTMVGLVVQAFELGDFERLEG